MTDHNLDLPDLRGKEERRPHSPRPPHPQPARLGPAIWLRSEFRRGAPSGNPLAAGAVGSCNGTTVQAPNPTTVRAMKELDDGKGQRLDSAEELFRDLDM